jgi:hypothetical protein
MRRVAVLALSVMLSLGFVEPGIAGPFGLSMGMKPAEVGGKLEKTQSLGVYHTTEVPEPHSSFDLYTLRFGPKIGLCGIVASGKPVETSTYGAELRWTFDDLEDRLKVQYGKNKRLDYLRATSIWHEPRDFMSGLRQKDRVLWAMWKAKFGSMLRDNLGVVGIKAIALSRNKGVIQVSYEFENIKECTKELEATEDNAL